MQNYLIQEHNNCVSNGTMHIFGVPSTVSGASSSVQGDLRNGLRHAGSGSHMGATGSLLALVDTTGNELLKPSFDTAGMFFEGFAAVAKDGKYGFVNTNGKLVIPTLYEEVGSFVDGIVAVTLGGETFYIDREGKKVD